MTRSLLKASSLVLLLFVATTALAQEEEDVNQLDVSLQMLGHGEMRLGGFDQSESNDEDMDEAYFLMQRSRLVVDYKRPNLETKVVAQHKGIWGQKAVRGAGWGPGPGPGPGPGSFLPCVAPAGWFPVLALS